MSYTVLARISHPYSKHNIPSTGCLTNFILPHPAVPYPQDSWCCGAKDRGDGGPAPGHARATAVANGPHKPHQPGKCQNMAVYRCPFLPSKLGEMLYDQHRENYRELRHNHLTGSAQFPKHHYKHLLKLSMVSL